MTMNNFSTGDGQKIQEAKTHENLKLLQKKAKDIHNC